MKGYLVELLEEGELLPIGCADTFRNALKILSGRSGRISTTRQEFLIARG